MATNENIRVVQLTDDNDNPVSPVVNVGSLYDKNGNKVDNLLSYKLAGTNVPVPEIKNIQAELTAKVDAKLAELDAAVTKLEKAAESGAKVTFAAKVKAGETVEKYMPVDVENGECYTRVETSNVVGRKLTGEIFVGYLGNNIALTCTDNSNTVKFMTERLDAGGSTVITSASVSWSGSTSCKCVKSYKFSDTVYYVFAEYKNTANDRYVFKVEIPNPSKITVTKYQDTAIDRGEFKSIIRLSDTTFLYSVYYSTYQWAKFDTTTNTFTLFTISGSTPRVAAGPITETAFLATMDNSNDVMIYDIAGTTITSRGTYTALESSDDYPELTSRSYAIGNGKVLFEYYSSYSLINGMYLFDCSGTSAVKKSKLLYSDRTSGFWSFGKAASMIDSNGKFLVLHKNLISLKLELNEVTYNDDTLAFGNTIQVMDSAANSDGEYCNHLAETEYGYIGACDLTSAAKYYRLVLNNNGVYDTVVPTTSGALALNSANAGETVDLLYSGVIKDVDVKSGYRLDTRGFTAEAPVDGTLIVTRMSNDYSGQTEIVSYTGNGKYGADNPCQLKFSFKPKSVILLGNYLGIWDDYTANSVMKTLLVDMVSSSYTPNFGFFMKGSSGAQSNTYCKFDSSTNTLYWYSNSDANGQFNATNTVYYFMGIK